MKPSRFILNSDYATLKNDAEGVVQLTVPNLVNIPASGDNVVYKATLQIGTPSAALRSYVTSSKYAYALSSPSFFLACKQDGYDSSASVDISRNGPNIELRVTFASAYGAATKYTGMGQVLTLHVETFVDPFQA